MHLYEAHLPVADTNAAARFYHEVVGLAFAYRDPTRDIVFIWEDAKEKAMIGLWEPETGYGKLDGHTQKHHIAFAVPLNELFAAIPKLTKHGVETLGFGGEKTSEPTVIGWMPSAQIYFRDPDGHLLEFISILPEPPNPEFNGLYSEWHRLTSRNRNQTAS
jgi:lactoylglutathione lyase